MLNYLITVTETLIVTAILTGLLYAYAERTDSARGIRILHIGALCGLFAASVMSVLKNTTSLIQTGIWNVRIFSVSLLAAIVLGVFGLPVVRKKAGDRGVLISLIANAVLLFTLLFYALPDVYAYPFNFSLGTESVFSSAFFTRLIGWFAGVALAFLTGVSVYRIGKRASDSLLAGVLTAAVAVNGVEQISKILRVLYQRRVIKGHAVFVFIREAANRSHWFIYLVIAAVLVIPVVLWLKSFRVNEPYENPAQHRKIRAKWRSARRWSTTAAVCFALAIVTLTAVSAYANRPVELSPVEECELRGGNMYVPLTQVEDGHLHRFAYTTPDDITVRFIVIKKPNSSSYGVGLDACDICGETGYFERNGQIVCKLCDVVMNINTIGFKGGCNPIVIDYSVDGGYIIVPTSTLIEHQNEFK